MKKIALLATPLVLALSGCGAYASTQPDEVAVHQRGYDIIKTDRTIDPNCVQPAHTQRLGYGDKDFIYPAGERQWKFSDEQGSDSGPIEVTTSDNQVVRVFGNLKFYLNTSCKVLNAFHQRLGRKQWGGTPGYVNGGDFRGWDGLIATNLNDPLQSVLIANAPAYATLGLWKDQSVRSELRAKVLAALPAEIKRQTGGEFFDHFTLTITKVLPPAATVEALQRQANAASLKAAQLAENSTAATRYAQITACIGEIHNLDACTFIYAVDSGKVAAVIPPGAGVTVR